MQPDKGYPTTNQSNAHLIKLLTRCSRYPSLVVFLAFVPLIVFAVSGPPETIYWLTIAVRADVLIFVSGIGCVCLLVAREMILRNQRPWRFSLGTLLVVMAVIAMLLGVLAMADLH